MLTSTSDTLEVMVAFGLFEDGLTKVSRAGPVFWFGAGHFALTRMPQIVGSMVTCTEFLSV